MKKFNGQVKIVYNDEEDAFELWTRVGEAEWGLVMSCRCFPISENNKLEYIHFTFLRKLEECIRLGYKLV